MAIPQNTPPVRARKLPSTAFKPGQSGNPGGRPKAIQNVVEAAREHSALAITTLADISRDAGQPAAARVAASGILLDRGWGKASQPIVGENGAGIVLQIISGVDREPGQIEGPE